jgi:hypothetical protein
LKKRSLKSERPFGKTVEAFRCAFPAANHGAFAAVERVDGPGFVSQPAEGKGGAIGCCFLGMDQALAGDFRCWSPVRGIWRR